MTRLAERLAGAPISWGVCEVPGWGHRMAPRRVLAEMRELGLRATELGPPDYLPTDPTRLRRLLERSGLRLAAGFLATVLHDPARWARTAGAIASQATTLAEAGADVLVLAAALPQDGYDRRQPLDDAGWGELAATLARAEDVAAANGLELVLHPHVGTAVETADEVARLLETTRVGLCLDTGHLLLGGADPAQVTTAAGSRVRHVHLKDVDGEIAARVREGRLSYAEAVRRGLYRPLGEGAAGIRTVLALLREAGYQGWYVLEQDTALQGPPEPGAGPAASVLQSLEFLWRECLEEEDGQREELEAERSGGDRGPRPPRRL